MIDPATGQAVASADQTPLRVWLTDLHRAFLLDDTGRVASALTAAAMLVLAGPVRRWWRGAWAAGGAGSRP